MMSCPLCRGDLEPAMLMLDANGKPVEMRVCATCGSLVPAFGPKLAADAETSRQVAFHERWWSTMDQTAANDLLAGSRGIIDALSPDLALLGDRPWFCEIGCGRGGLLAAARERGFQVLGREPSSYLSGLARTWYGLGSDVLLETPAADFILRIGMIEAPKAVVFWHSLEHLSDAAAIWEQTAKATKPGDLLFLQLPCPLQDYIYPEHLFFAGERAITVLAEHGGMELLRIDYDRSLGFMSVVLRRIGRSPAAIVPTGTASQHRNVLALAEAERDLAAARALCNERLASIQHMEHLIRERDEALIGQRALIEERWSAMEAMEAMIRQRDERIAATNGLVLERNNTITSQQSIIDERWSAMQVMEAMIRQRDEHIAATDGLVNARNETITSQQAIIDERWSAMQVMEAMIRQRDERIATTDGLVNARNETIASQQAIIDERWAAMQAMEAMIRQRDERIAATELLVR